MSKSKMHPFFKGNPPKPTPPIGKPKISKAKAYRVTVNERGK